MITPEDRKKIDTETLAIMIEQLSYAMPYTDKDLAQVFLQGQQTMLFKLSQMIVGHPTGEGFKGIIVEDQLAELGKEVFNASEAIRGESGNNPAVVNASGPESES